MGHACAGRFVALFLGEADATLSNVYAGFWTSLHLRVFLRLLLALIKNLAEPSKSSPNKLFIVLYSCLMQKSILHPFRCTRSWERGILSTRRPSLRSLPRAKLCYLRLTNERTTSKGSPSSKNQAVDFGEELSRKPGWS